MNEAAIGLIGAGVGTIARVLFMAKLSGRAVIIIGSLAGAVLTFLFGLQYRLLDAKHAFDLTMGYLDVLGIAAGSFHLLEELPKAVANPDGIIRKMTGTGDGSQK